MADNKKSLLDLRSLADQNYENVDLDRLAVYALWVMESKKIPLYFDYAAIAVFKLFPGKFSMANFSQYPDTNRINKTLRRLTDQKRKNWATGTVEQGFSLNDLGREVGKQVSELLNNPELQKGDKIATPTRSRGRSAIAEVREIRNSDSFKKWSNKELVNNYEFFSFLKAAPYAPKPMLVEHLARLKDSASEVADQQVSDFLKWLETNFTSLLH